MKKVASSVQTETILAWPRRLEQKKRDYSSRRTRGPGRPQTPHDVEALVCRPARENAWGYQRTRGELLKLHTRTELAWSFLQHSGFHPSIASLREGQ